jgi:hypothetical protein
VTEGPVTEGPVTEGPVTEGTVIKALGLGHCDCGNGADRADGGQTVWRAAFAGLGYEAL